MGALEFSHFVYIFWLDPTEKALDATGGKKKTNKEDSEKKGKLWDFLPRDRDQSKGRLFWRN